MAANISYTFPSLDSQLDQLLDGPHSAAGECRTAGCSRPSHWRILICLLFSIAAGVCCTGPSAAANISYSSPAPDSPIDQLPDVTVLRVSAERQMLIAAAGGGEASL